MNTSRLVKKEDETIKAEIGVSVDTALNAQPEEVKSVSEEVHVNVMPMEKEDENNPDEGCYTATSEALVKRKEKIGNSEMDSDLAQQCINQGDTDDNVVGTIPATLIPKKEDTGSIEEVRSTEVTIIRKSKPFEEVQYASEVDCVDDVAPQLEKGDESILGKGNNTTLEALPKNEEEINDSQKENTFGERLTSNEDDANGNIGDTIPVALTLKKKEDRDSIEEDENVMDSKEEEEGWESSLHEIYEELKLLDPSNTMTTCTGGSAKMFPSIPGLNIEGVGHIPLPVTEFFAEKIKHVAEQAPHGQGMETVVDKSIRNTLQVDASKVKLENPAWRPALQGLVEEISNELGINTSMVRAEFYKLLLYEPGGFFKKHRDTEKFDGMFATLVVQLPSIFTGAAFIVSHNGQSHVFTLDGKESAYDCQFVAHYADCEHQIKPVESGYRLALVYSLCYTGSQNCKPTANAIGTFKALADQMKHLPNKDSLFCLALDHQYTSASMNHFGVGALKGRDRKYQQALTQAGGDDWKMIVVWLQRIDEEYGEMRDYYDFESHGNDRGEPEFVEMYNEDGSDASSDRQWISQQLDLESLDDGGMVVNSEDVDINDMWVEDDSEIECTGNEGATRQTTYHTYMLVVFSKRSVFERLCRHSISIPVQQVIDDPTLLPRIMKYLKYNPTFITSKECSQLLSLVQLDKLSDNEIKSTLHIILSCHPRSTFAPNLTKMCIRIINNNGGWNETTEPIQHLLVSRIAPCDIKVNCEALLNKIDLFLLLTVTPESDFLFCTIEKSIASFEKATISIQVPRNSYYHQSSTKYTASNTANRIVELSSCHGWSKIKAGVLACFARLRKESVPNIPSELLKRANALEKIRQNVSVFDANDICKEIVQDFVEDIQNISLSSDINNLTLLAKFLFEFGDNLHLQRFKQWVSGACSTRISKISAAFYQVSVSDTPKLEAKKRSYVEILNRQLQEQKVQDLRQEYQTLQTQQHNLIRALRNGTPNFSWSMPNAQINNSTLKSFFGSSEVGPKTIVVGGGVKYARSLAYGLQSGYSATISVRGTGRNAAVVVTKTRAFYDAQMKKYQDDKKEFGNIEEKLLSLKAQITSFNKSTAVGGVSASVPGGTTNHQPGLAQTCDLTDNVGMTNPPKKRTRIEPPPLPKDVEVINID